MSDSDLRLEIPVEVERAFLALGSLGSDGINRLIEALDRTGPFLGKPAKRAHLVAPDMDGLVDEDQLLGILRDVVVPMADARERFELSARQLYETVISSIERSDKWSVDVLKGWKENRESILTLLGNVTLELEAKAAALLRARTDRVTRLRVFSDLRPVYDKSADSIRAHVLMNTLHVTYLEGGEIRKKSFALRPDQIQVLAEQIDRAKRKNEVLAKQPWTGDVPVLGLPEDFSDLDDRSKEQ